MGRDALVVAVMDPFEFLLRSYEGATEGWITEAVEVGFDLFRKLAALELGFFGILVALKSRGGLPAVLPDFTWKLFLLAVLWTALLIYPVWMPTIAPSFTGLAEQISGFSTLNPVVMLEQGIALSIALLAAGFTAGWIGPSLVGAIWTVLAAVGVLVAYIAMTVILARTLIESWIVLATGPMFLGFSPFKLTAQLADNFLVYAFQVGIRLFFLMVLASVGRNVAIEWAEEIAQHGLDSYGLVLQVLAGSILMAVVLWTLPRQVTDALTRGWQFGIRQGLAD